MLEWLRELGSFHRIGSAVVAILPILAAACLGAFLATWLQEWLRVRREHRTLESDLDTSNGWTLCSQP